MDPGQLVVPVAGIIAAAAVTFYVVSFQQMSAKSFQDYDANLDDDDDDGPRTQLKSSLSSRKRREAKQASKSKPK